MQQDDDLVPAQQTSSSRVNSGKNLQDKSGKASKKKNATVISVGNWLDCVIARNGSANKY